MMTRAEHLAWAKERALEYVDGGDLQQAFSSMCSDLQKHEELATQHADTNKLGLDLLLNGHLSTREAMRNWIEGYN